METSTLSEKANKIAFDYLNLPLGGKFVRTPYYNNKHKRVRGGLRAQVGKGKPEDIVDEAILCAMKEKVKLSELAPENLTKFLVDHNLGVDCSGLVYHILDAECRDRGKGSLASHLKYPHNGGLLGRLLRFIRRRYVENTNTLTFAHPSNSSEVQPGEIAAGDMVVLIDRGTGERNHLLTVKAVEKDKVILIHSIAMPEDGKYNHGVRLEIITKSGQLLNELRERYHAGSIWLRRLNVFS